MTDDSALALGDLLAREAPAILQIPAAAAVFWTGAGVSADPPTGAPVGNSLAGRAMAHCFAGQTADTVAASYADLRVSRPGPRLETLLDVVCRVHGLAVLADVLADLRQPPPNGIHEFFAAHVGAGGRHLTANFDACIERAAAAAGHRADVFHFHGSFAQDPTGASLGATLANIERGFPASIGERLTSMIAAAPRQLLVFAGYSGTDFFDADPFLRNLAARPGEPGQLSGTVVLWINHRDQPPSLISGPDAAKARPQLAWLARAGAEVHQVTALTRPVLTALAAAWRLSPPGPVHGTSRPWHPCIALTEPAREQATLELFGLMGLHRQVTALLARRGGAASTREWELAAHSWWAAGRYRQASAAWQQARSADSEAGWLACQERLGACQWIRGQYNRAYRTLRRSLVLAARLPADQNALDLQVQIAETLGRVWVHARRTPDSRLLATRRRRAFILSHLPVPGLPSRLGTHLQARIQSVRADLGEPAGTADEPASRSRPWQESQAAFAEYEALNARLNYRHAELRHTRPAPGAHEFRQLQQDFQALGAWGDAARVPLIPGGETAFTRRETLRGLRSIDVTRWHRYRLSAGYLAKRTLAQVRRRRPQPGHQPQPGQTRTPA